MLVTLDILCKYKVRLSQYYMGYEPVFITFLNKDNPIYHIIVADNDNKKCVVKLVNAYLLSIPKDDKLILAFSDNIELANIDFEITFLYATYLGLKIENDA